MAKVVAIVGNGVVGSAMRSLFDRAYRTNVYDPGQGYVDKMALDNVDLAVICVPTPMGPGGHADLSFIHDAAKLCQAIPLVVIKSAVPPGTTDRLNTMYDNGRFHVSPEYIGQLPNYVDRARYLDPQEAASHPFCIVGGPRAPEVLQFFQRCMAVTARYIPCKAVEAELCKYMENSFLATKVTFCNEWAMIAAAFGVSYEQLRHLWLQDPRIGASHTVVFKDEPGFSGKCLPKDLSAIIAASEDRGFFPRLLANVREINSRVRK